MGWYAFAGRYQRLRAVTILLVVVVAAVTIYGYSTKYSRDANEARLVNRLGGYAAYHWDGPDWLEYVWRRTGAGFGYARLIHVEVRGERFTEDEFTKLTLAHVDTLKVDTSLLSPSSIAHIGKMIQLESLILRIPQLSGAWLSPLKDMPKLRTLVLTGSGIGDADVMAISALSNLRNLDIGFTEITDDGVCKLLVAMPNIEKVSISPDQATEQLEECWKSTGRRTSIAVFEDPIYFPAAEPKREPMNSGPLN